MPNQKVKLFSLSSNKELVEKISNELNVPIGKSTVKHFSDGEIQISVDESIRGDDIYVVQSLSDPVNTNLMELIIMVDAIRRTSAGTINVVIPYYGYSRSDRKARSREPIISKMIASFIEMQRVDRVITLDLHATQIQGFFNIPVDHLKPTNLFIEYFKDNGLLDNTVIVSPDHTTVNRARLFADRLKLPIAIVDNRNPDDETNIPDSVIGDVKDKNVIITDDMIVTGKKLDISAKALKKAGAKNIYVSATHPVFADGAIERLNNSPINKIIVSDSINIKTNQDTSKIDVVSVGSLFGKAIDLIENNKSTGKLFK
ncbi:ribose-phosphate diphosphokinase [Lactobacillus sp. S2-2]|uniref:ribose-phosphate diphosphokinase n=1 Tax=Lactobacillus sp. S2-2 TaxID=2692917 RepID=UPI001F007967|nr:ribose-phosphate diphosphokinase [Lactobacillus sp. S2-2]MCF6514874.1 ribose-phosphate diphosphokinase [Lactobacillus sp. S2-2]